MICHCDDCELERFLASLTYELAPNCGKLWTRADVERLRELRDQNLPLSKVARELGRSVIGVQYATKRYLEEGQQPHEEI